MARPLCFFPAQGHPNFVTGLTFHSESITATLQLYLQWEKAFLRQEIC